MRQLGADSGYEFPQGSTGDPVHAVLGLGQHIIGGYLERHGLAGQIPADGLPLFSVLENFALHLVEGIEKALGIPCSDSSLPARIAKARSKIHQLRSDPSVQPHPEIAGLADRAILALRIHGYLTPYLTEHPTIDRYDETVERIAEDFYSRAMPRTGPRRAMAMIHPPIDVRAFSEMKLREALPKLTERMERAVQSGIDELNKNNIAPGAALVDAR
jgi:hypothetical protein